MADLKAKIEISVEDRFSGPARKVAASSKAMQAAARRTALSSSFMRSGKVSRNREAAWITTSTRGRPSSELGISSTSSTTLL